MERASIKRRGGQPGNQNAKNNRGNRNARGSKGNRGGKGAPPLNQFAAKILTLDIALVREFGTNPEAMGWIKQNAAELREIVLPKENCITSSKFSVSTEHLATTGQEYRLGVFRASEEG